MSQPSATSVGRIRTAITSWPTLVLLTILSEQTVSHSYTLATSGSSPDLYYAVFWAGLLPVWLVLAVAAVQPPRGWRTHHLLVAGFVTWFPKYLRNPYGPLFHDEVAHDRAARDLLVSGHFFLPNPIIPLIGRYPGLHILTGSVAEASGLGPYDAGIAILFVSHVLAVLAVYVLAKGVLLSSRAASVATLVYATNANFMLFDNQLAYESLAISLVVSALALTVTAERRRRSGRAWGRYSAAAALAATMCVPTHALSTVMLFAINGLVIASHLLARRGAGRQPRSPAMPWLITFGATAAAAVGWFLVVAPGTLAYLMPYPTGAFQQLLTLVSGGGGSRTLFIGSVQPAWERYSAYAAQVCLLLVSAVFIRRWFHRRSLWRKAPTASALMVLTGAYFASIPFIFASSGAEGARRSWSFSYVGVALMVAVTVLGTLRSQGPRRAIPSVDVLGQSRRVSALRGAAVYALASVLFVGNVAAGLNDAYRFPGPYRFGSDTRDRPAEVRSMVAFLSEHDPTGKLVTDRYTAMSITADSRMVTGIMSRGFHASTLFTQLGDPDPLLKYQLAVSQFDYMIVDRRISHLLPQAGWYFEPDEPVGYQGNTVDQRALDRLLSVPWATAVVTTDHFVVYRLDMTQVGRP